MQSFNGFISNIILHDSFIINPYGIIKEFNYKLSNISSNTYYQFDAGVESTHHVLRGTTKTNCLTNSDVVDSTIISGSEFQCFYD